MVTDKYGKPVKNARILVKGIRHDVTTGEPQPAPVCGGGQCRPPISPFSASLVREGGSLEPPPSGEPNHSEHKVHAGTLCVA